ncbi:MAG: aspartate/glutamate racemase family protein [Dehalococcoidia bacterium]|nr:aspartate/glutamate racemase family protein [Dehalococcoidia bacterium]
MKIIGLIGGMGWQSTAKYYQVINETVAKKLGGLHSAKIVLYSVDFAEIEEMQHQDNWEDATKLMIHAAQSIEKSGANLILICTNTMHMMADDIANSINIPLLHIIDAVANKINSLGFTNVGLLGTRFTMENNFYKGRLINKHKIGVVTPNEADRIKVHNIIYHELCLGKIKVSSKEMLKKIITRLGNKNAQGIILGCTELSLLIKQDDCSIPLLDTTRIHAEAAVDCALEK